MGQRPMSMIPIRRLASLKHALRAAAMLSALVALAACSSGAGLASNPPAAPAREARALARLEPPTGAYFGVNLDWAHDSADEFAQRVGRPAAVFVAFAHLPIAEDEDAYIDGYIAQVRAQHGIALLTLEPDIPLRQVTPEVAVQLADRLARYNAEGVPVIVRFAHEMNGSWYPWGQQPAAYIAAFRTIAAAVHERTNQSAMMWAPNYGAGYPFDGGSYRAQTGTNDFTLLDTNGDGVLDGHDDPYAAYYPGDDAVDWVGMTLYHWGDAWPWGKNVAPEPGKFIAQLTGTYNGVGGDQRGLPDFYHVYAEVHGKPMAIPETAALYNTAAAGDAELDIKRAWWQQVFSEEVAHRFPEIKMINWFEWRKPEAEIQNAVVDWTATLDPAIRGAFVADLPTDRLRFGVSDVRASEVTASPVSDQPESEPLPAPAVDAMRTIQFAGYTWDVRATESLEGPGPNYFSSTSEHVWVDDAGRLHLRVAPDADGHWYAAEVTARAFLGYGVYRFTIDGRVDDLDENAAVGLFTWSDDPAQNHRELDIEFAHFGHPDAPVGRYTLQPYTDPDNVELFQQPPAPTSSHVFEWTPGRVTFTSWIGTDSALSAASERIAQHEFTRAIPDPRDTRVHLNFWLDGGNPPADAQPMEIIIRDFGFSPS